MDFLEQTTMTADTKLTVVMCCHIFDRGSVAPSIGDFRQKPRAPRRTWCDKSQNFRTDLTRMWVQFKLKHFVLNHYKKWTEGKKQLFGIL